ncbi:CotH kinase family protein [Commensalibacter sp. A3DC]|uniref:CotH kinase family protein n=1 Tax=Commensalibacter sp. A3DC TaxID=3093920 RepID=UPI0039B56724
MSVSVFEGTIPLFSSTGTWNLQGQTSLNSAKKNFKIKFKNAETGKKLKVKIGDWAPMNGLVLKGYGTDRTLLRDIVTTEIWRNFHRDEAGLLAPASSLFLL